MFTPELSKSWVPPLSGRTYGFAHDNNGNVTSITIRERTDPLNMYPI